MQVDTAVYKVSDIQKLLAISKNTAYTFMKNAPFEVIKIGSTYRVSKEVFNSWLQKQ